MGCSSRGYTRMCSVTFKDMIGGTDTYSYDSSMVLLIRRRCQAYEVQGCTKRTWVLNV